MKKVIRVFSIDEAMEEYRDLVKAVNVNVQDKAFYDYLLLSAYYQQLLLLGYSVLELFQEFLFPTELTLGGYELQRLTKSVSISNKIEALITAIECLQTIGYRTVQGRVYFMEDFELPKVVQDIRSLRKKKSC